jgi:proteasome assembly chaperone (PAC2) family protein
MNVLKGMVMVEGLPGIFQKGHVAAELQLVSIWRISFSWKIEYYWHS